MINDNMGNWFSSVDEMCEFHGIRKSIYFSRMESKWDMKKALTTPRRQTHYHPCYDHKGVKYNTKIDMLEHYGLTYTLFELRIKKGYTLEEILTRKKNDRSKPNA